MLQLTVRSPETEAGQSCSISGSSVTIGRNRLNDLCLGDGTVSDFHAEIIPEGNGGWKLNDHDSSNGTCLNGKRVTTKPVSIGDIIAFGDVETVVEKVEVELGDADDNFEVPTVAAEKSSSEEVSEELLPNSTLPTAQIEQAMAMHQARIGGKVPEKVPKKVAPEPGTKDAPGSSPKGEIAQMRDRLKHSLDELESLKDKHALQTRELESYQERADLLEDPDADVTKLRIQVSEIKSKCDQAEKKLKARDKEVARLKKLSEADEPAADNTGISTEDHQAAIEAAAEKVKVAGEKQLTKQVAELCKEHRAEIRDLKKQQTAQQKTKQSDRSEIEALEKRIEELTAESDERNSEQEGHDAELAKHDKQLAAKKGEVTKLKKLVAELQGTIENLQGDDATRSDEVANLSAERDEQVALVEKQQAEMEELTALHETTAGKLRKANAERDEIKTAGLQTIVELQDAKSEIKKFGTNEAKLQKRIAELGDQVKQSDEDTVAENAKLGSDLERSAAKNSALEAQLAESAEKTSELEEAVAEQQAAVISKVAALSVVQEELSEKEEAISGATETEAELRAVAAEHEKTIGELRAEVDTLSGESGDVSEQLSESRSKIESLKEELAPLKKEQGEVGAAGKILEKLKSEAEALRAGMEELKQEGEQMQSDLDDERVKLGRERVEIDAERVSLKAELDESEREAKAAREKLQGADQELEAKRRELDSELEELQSSVIIERRRAEEMTGKAEAAEQRAEKAAALLKENAKRWDKAETGAKKEESRLASLRRKLVRRRKLLEKLKGIGRREQALKRKIAEAHGLLQAAEDNKPGKAAPAVPRPWDVDKAVENHEVVLRKTRELEAELQAKRAEWEKIDKDVLAGKGPLGDKAQQINLDEFTAAIDRAKELETIIERMEIEKLSLINTVSTMKAKIAATAAGAQGSVVP